MEENKGKKYPLTNDIIFKAVYGREDESCKKALVAMLNLILGKENQRIVEVEIKNPMNDPSRESGKLSILDIKCKTNIGEVIGVEMQVKKKTEMEKRIIYYQGKMIGDSLNKSEEYATIKKVATICIMVENLFHDVKEFHSIYRYKDVESGRELSTVSEIHFIELSKIDNKKKVNEMSVLERYGLYLLYANDNSKCGLMKSVRSCNDEVIVMTESILNYVTAEDKIKQAADDREMFLWDLEVDKILAAQEKEKITQEKEKILQERVQEKREIVAKLKLRRLSLAEIAEIVGMSIDEVMEVND